MESERNEVYERIPWETLEQKRPDRQWILFAVAGAIVVGALAYSYTSSQPAPVPAGEAVAASQAVSEPPTQEEAVPVAPVIPAATPETTSPVLATEADLYAVDPERLIDRAAAHAEWFAAEYVTVDGSEQSAQTVAALLPAGIPLPVAPEGVSVFVESARAFEVVEVAPARYRVEVMVRSLRASGNEIYERQAPMALSIDVIVDESGPRVALPPTVNQAVAPNQETATLGLVPDEVASAALAASGGSEVLGGSADPAGGWRVVVMASQADGITRPVTVRVP